VHGEEKLMELLLDSNRKGGKVIACHAERVTAGGLGCFQTFHFSLTVLRPTQHASTVSSCDSATL